MRRSTVSAVAVFLMSGCMTVAEDGLYKEFRGFGFSRTESDCMVRVLEKGLSGTELSDLAVDARWIRNDSDRADVIYALLRVSDPRVKGALAGAGEACLNKDG